MASGILMEMTIDDVRKLRPEVVVMGVGSVEPHGPVLPYGTDTYQTDALLRRATVLANERGGRVLMYPTLPVGNNVNFKHFPFACRIGVDTLMQTLVDIFTALQEDGIRKIVVTMGHGGNTDTIRAALRLYMDRASDEKRAFVCLYSSPPAGDLEKHPSQHGGERETSSMMNLCPDLVRADKLQNFPFGELAVEALDRPNVHFVKPWHLYVPASAGGETREASAEKGRKLLERNSSFLADFLVSLSNAPWTATFPFKG